MKPAAEPKTTRQCVRCELVAPVEEFRVINKRTGRRDSYCPPCRRAYMRAYKAARRVAPMPRITYTEKMCSFCRKVKPLEKFGKDRTRIDGCTYRCRECLCDYERAAYARRAAAKAAELKNQEAPGHA